jgi:CRP-like cAMP-binding protein
MDDRAKVLGKTPLFASLDAPVLELLASRIVERTLKPNGILFIAGDPADGLYVIAEGSVRAFRSGADGREQVIHVERAVTTIAEVPVFDDGAYPSTVAAEEISRVYFIAKEDIRKISLAHPQLALAAAKLLAARLRHCADMVESLSLRDVSQRIAKVLVQEAVSRGVSSGKGSTFVQKLTHNQLAARIGTVREVVSRSLTRLETTGLITIRGKKVDVPDIGALRSYADS